MAISGNIKQWRKFNGHNYYFEGERPTKSAIETLKDSVDRKYVSKSHRYYRVVKNTGGYALYIRTLN